MGMFQEAIKRRSSARILIGGPPKAGKTYNALQFAFDLVGPHDCDVRRKVAVLDTEHGSSTLYRGKVVNGQIWRFDHCPLEHFDPSNYVQIIKEAARLGYEALVIDSLSHAWQGTGGALEQVDKAKETNSFTAWKEVTPKQNELVESMLRFPGHMIVTVRTKMEYIIEEQMNTKGKTVKVPKKVGMKPIQRDGMEYEFDMFIDITQDHEVIVGGSRCEEMDGVRATKPGPGFLAPLIRFLNEGEAPLPAPQFSEPPKVDYSADVGSIPAGQSLNINGPCIPEQLQEISDLAQSLGLPVEALRAAVAKRGKQYARELTYAEAREMIGNLKARKEEAEAAATFG